ncbi:MAG: AAA family ATPase [Veillonella sp.]|jgi:ATPase associated with various cellular activities AAA_5|uniref:AAA family ATPase n=1 Tax=Bacillota TaxID=1239 RepID=UPI0026F369AD|nr:MULTISPECIES: AAA family ATPase [Bacillota]MDU5295445.1 AAA family ATPase [Veillonella sp.]MDU5870972.1 AAA family ATPase [Veillonella sp.]MDU5892059.1 AAA family ATPase [Peptostreptococcus sp.]MDU7822978.1 AAA family ATPase [Veillonella sp.]
MNSINQFDWIDFYKEFANTLLQYKNNRGILIEKVERIYELTGIDMPTLDRNKQLVDIDPFTIFGLFNKSSMTVDNRNKIIAAVANLFDIKAPIPTSFDGIPLLNNQNATYYYFIDERDEDDIDTLWGLYESALMYANDSNSKNILTLFQYFDLAINKKGNGNSKITMGLYWIAPTHFLNLDQRNTWYIYESGKMPDDLVNSLPIVEDKISASKYFEIVHKLRTFLDSNQSIFKNFIELSFEAWRYSEEVNRQNRADKKQRKTKAKGAALADDDIETIHYWIYSPGKGAKIWDECYDNNIMAIGWDEIGDLRNYDSKDEIKQVMNKFYDPFRSYIHSACATWEFANEMKPGDIVFAKNGMHLIIGRGIVKSDYIYDPQRKEFKNIRKVEWTDRGEWECSRQSPMKTLTDITSFTDYVEQLNLFFNSDMLDDVETIETSYPTYDKDRFLDSVYMNDESYNTLVSLVKGKKNIILQGAPGVGKTFAAKRLAYSMMGVKDPNRVMMVQFHQSYSYEDFIMGFRPSENGFKLKYGVFYEFCKRAEVDSDNDYFFIIDEINRGNLSKIFGELFMLLESDKRGVALQLLYADEKFSIPENLYIIGMMNTADRSLAMLDYALRRRFAFFDLKPAFESDGFKSYQKDLNSDKFDKLIECIKRLNLAIKSDEILGAGFCIGHSYFCDLDKFEVDELEAVLIRIVDFEIIPLLSEYWFDDVDMVNEWSNNLRSAIK